MALDTTEVSIGSTRYQLTALPAERGRRTLVRLLKIVGPSVAALFRGRGQVTAAEAVAISGDAIANAIQELAERLTEEDLEYLVKTFTASTEVMAENGFVPLEKQGTFALFARDYGGLLQWLLLSIDFNFSSFLAVLRATASPK